MSISRNAGVVRGDLGGWGNRYVKRHLWVVIEEKLLLLLLLLCIFGIHNNHIIIGAGPPTQGND
jgi:hypothetical protein